QLAVVRNQYAEGAAALKEALEKGYSIKLAAHDPELKPLLTDAELKRRVQYELKNSQDQIEANAW
ncbi:MAG: hypothetical protein ABI883_05320, partial [Chthoniobacterales bacterium]